MKRNGGIGDSMSGEEGPRETDGRIMSGSTGEGGDSGPECRRASEGDTVERYVAGSLSGPQAEAFEAHYFRCEECWALVRSAVEVRAAFDAAGDGALRPPAERSTGRPLSSRRPLMLPAAALAAAVAGLALFGVWRSDPVEAPIELFRGTEQAMALEAVIEGGVLRARWDAVTDAAEYELRLFDGDGRLLRAIMAPGPSITVDLDPAEIGEGDTGATGVATVDVVALDDFGQSTMRSPRVAPSR